MALISISFLLRTTDGAVVLLVQVCEYLVVDHPLVHFIQPSYLFFCFVKLVAFLHLFALTTVVLSSAAQAVVLIGISSKTEGVALLYSFLSPHVPLLVKAVMG